MGRDKVVAQLQAHVQELREMGVKSLALFGSVARDEATENSDVDLLVELDPAFHAGLFGFVRVQQRIEDLLGVRVDLVMPSGLHEELKQDILGEAIPIVCPSFAQLPACAVM